MFLRQFDVPISWKEKLFYLQRDYAIFISLQCIDLRPTENEGFETEPYVKYTLVPMLIVKLEVTNACLIEMNLLLHQGIDELYKNIVFFSIIMNTHK